MAIGGLDQAFLCVIADNSASPLKVNSDWPWKRGILQKTAQKVNQHANLKIQCPRAINYLLPYDAVLGWCVFRLSSRANLDFNFSRIEGSWDLEDDVVCIKFWWEVGLDIDFIFNSCSSNFIDNRMNLEWQIHVFCCAISTMLHSLDSILANTLLIPSSLKKHLPHKFEFAIGWYKANGSVAIEFTKLDALMKLAIVDFNSVGSTQRAKEAPWVGEFQEHVIGLPAYTYFDFVTASLSSSNLSFKPNLHSGVPDRYALIRICPETSARSTVPKGIEWLLKKKAIKMHTWNGQLTSVAN